jgi:hypothetical protein
MIAALSAQLRDKFKHWTNVGLPSISANLGKEEVDAEWRILVVQVLLDRMNLETSRVRHLQRGLTRDVPVTEGPSVCILHRQ